MIEITDGRHLLFALKILIDSNNYNNVLHSKLQSFISNTIQPYIMRNKHKINANITNYLSVSNVS